MRKIQRTIFVLLLLSNFFAKAQNTPIIDRLTSNNGLSHNTIRCMLRDTTGFLWFGSLNGLNRYDGVRIKNIDVNSQNSTGLSSGKIKELHNDSRGYIWMRTYSDNFHCYNPFTEQFITFFDAEQSMLRFNLLYEDKDKNMWLGSAKAGCVRISFDNDKATTTTFTHIDKANSLPSNTITDIFQDSRKRIWILTSLGMRILEGETLKKPNTKFADGVEYFRAFEFNDKVFLITKKGRIDIYNLQNDFFEESIMPDQKYDVFKAIEYDNDKILISTFGNGIWFFDTETYKLTSAQRYFNEEITGNAYFQKDNHENVWMYNYSGNVWLLNPNAATPVKLKLIPENMLAIIDEERFLFRADKHGSVWITTYGNGLFCYEPSTNTLTHFIYPDVRLSSNYLLSIILDDNENIWIGTESTGVNKLSFSNRNMRLIYPDESGQKRNGNVIRSLFEDRSGNIWVATKAGSIYKYNNNFSNRQTVFENGYNAYQIIEDSIGNIWIATRGKGIAKLPNGDHSKAIYYQRGNIPGSLSENGVFSMVFDRKGRLWAATFGGGLCVKLPDSDSFRSFFTNDDWIRFVRYVIEDKKGNLWAATSNGVFNFNPDSLLQNPENYIYYTQNYADKKSLSNPEIKQIFEDSKGRIWMATAGGGICKFVEDEGKGHFVTYKNNHGISSNNIMAIQEDNSGKLWISTESSLQTFDPETELFQSYRFSDNFISNLFSEATSLLCRNGKMLIGSLNGFYVFNPENLQIENRRDNKVTLTAFYIYDKEAGIDKNSAPLHKSVSYSDKIVLTAADRVFSIEFSNLNFREPTANQFMFILENYEKQWNLSGSYNTVTYRKVPPGKYIFKIKCLNDDGTWSDNITKLEIRISPPFYNSTLAYIIYILLAIVVIYIIIRIIAKFNKMNNDIQVEHSLTEYKLRFFTNISHEFRTPLTLIRSGVETLTELKPKMNEKMQQLTDDLDVNTSHLLRLIDQLLEFRKLQNNKQKLNLQMTDAVAFLKNIFSIYNRVANKMNIDYQFISQSEKIPVYLDRTKVDKMALNLLSNAFKFTPHDGKITFSIETDEDKDLLIIKICDNGIGIPKEKQHLLFSRFMQINFSASGTGIGLSLVQEFAALHKGNVKYKENHDGGSIFIIELPLSDKLYGKDDFVIEKVQDDSKRKFELSEFIDTNSDIAFLDTVPEPVIDKKYKILVVDDNDDIRDFLNERLSPYFDVITANNGNIGIYRSMEDDPDLIICDVMMPGMNGFTLTKRLKDDFSTCHIPVILLTAYISDEYNLEGIEAGADAYITKPFSLKHLMLQINKLIEKREHVQKHYSEDTEEIEEIENTTDGKTQENGLSTKDRQFMKLVEEIIEQNLTNRAFSIDDFAAQTSTGRTLFFKKIKSFTGYSPNEYIRVCRLQKAAKLLKSGKYNVSEVSYMTGFDDPFYFSKCFKAQFGCSPSKYLKE